LQQWSWWTVNFHIMIPFSSASGIIQVVTVEPAESTVLSGFDFFSLC
jgi:hypothetical protein